MRLDIKNKSFLFFFSLLAACGLWLAAFLCEPSALKIHFIDVGEGDAVFIEAPNGERALIDAGNAICGFKVAEYLKKQGVDSLDSLIFTHHHLDHIMGAFFILQMFGVKNIYDNGQDLNKAESDVYRWYSELARKSGGYRVLKAGDSFLLGETVFEVLWPDALNQADFNVNSLVVMVKYRSFRCLMAGDLTTAGEERLLEKGADLRADILKVGHHGAADTASLEFLKKVRPAVSLISVDKDNIRGYPSQDTLKRLKACGSKVMRTDKNGNIVITVDSKGSFRITKQD